MPFDLWIRSISSPPVFEPERIPIAAIMQHYDAQTTACGYVAADREVFIVEVDDAGRIIDDAEKAKCATNTEPTTTPEKTTVTASALTGP